MKRKLSGVCSKSVTFSVAAGRLKGVKFHKGCPGNLTALALLLAGPALSLPSMLVLKSVMGTKKTTVYVTLVVIMSTFTGMFYGAFF